MAVGRHGPHGFEERERERGSDSFESLAAGNFPAVRLDVSHMKIEI